MDGVQTHIKPAAPFTRGIVGMGNAKLEAEAEDHLYHLGFYKSKDDLPKKFGDVKFVCTGGSHTRIQEYAKKFSEEANLVLSDNLCGTDRYVLYKTGPVLWINHGMGNPSIGIMLAEMVKLLHYAGCTDVVAFRLGTSGGLGVEPGTVVVSTDAMNGELQLAHTLWVMGKKVDHSTTMDSELAKELSQLAKELGISAVTGVTMGADDFYEGEARLDGAYCDYTEQEKFSFLQKLQSLGVRNIEMESTCFASMWNRAGVRAAIVCVTLLDRTKGDQIDLTKEKFHDFEQRPYKLVTTYIKRKMGKVQ